MSRSCNRYSTVLRAVRQPSFARVEPPFIPRTSRRTLSSIQSSNHGIAQQRSASTTKSICLPLKERCPQSSRPFSSTASRFKLKTMQQIQTRNKGGPFSFAGALIFVASGVGLWMYFAYEKERLARKRIADQTKGVGKPKVGGPFDLVDQNGNRFTHEDLHGKYSLVYFGFSHCPDICPEELDKMAIMIDLVKERCGNVLLPVMITCDPARDTPEVLKEYLKEFHPDIIGLTGTWENVKATCKAYRVYFSTPPHVKPGQDYLVDHSIYFYLMDPEGDFVEAIGRNFTPEQAAKVMTDHIKDWNGPLNKKDYWA